MKVSIVTVCKNAERHIREAIRSVARQTYPDIEYIIVDGDSSDRTLEIVDEYENIVDRFLSEPDSGVFAAMNKGIQLATGSYIYFLNADDYLVDEKVIEDVAEFLKIHSDCDVLYGNLEVREESGIVHVFEPPRPEEIAEFMIYGSMPHQATFAKAEIFEKLGGFNEQYRIVADGVWFLNLLQYDFINWYYYPRTIGSYFMGGLTTENNRETRTEFWKAQNRASIYQNEHWHQKRLLKFQQIILKFEQELTDYKNQLSSYREQARYSQLDYSDDKRGDKPIQLLLTDLYESHRRVKRIRRRLQRAENDLREARNQITAMESSKFWKLKNYWTKLKQTLNIRSKQISP